MLNASDFKTLVSGRRRGLGPSLLRGLLRAAEVPYTLAVKGRNWRFDRGHLAGQRVAVPVVSVGNLTLGGTGKTPLVAWLARWFHQRGVRVALVSRGYGATSGGPNDEALELAQQLPGVPHYQDRVRVAAARLAIEQSDSQLILLDDAFQHRHLARDLDVVLLDALEPFGFDHVFPRGTLREPLAGLKRAHVVALSRADVLSAEERDVIRSRVAEYAPGAAWIEVRHAPRCWRSADGSEQPLESLAGRRVAAFCGLGTPDGFWHTLTTTGIEVVDRREFPDHYAYTTDDRGRLGEWADRLGADAMVCTHKDLVKLDCQSLGNAPLWALAIGIEIIRGQDEFEKLLRPLLRAAAA